jgi:hypothetical protein
MNHPIKNRQQFADIIKENNYRHVAEIGVRRGWFSDWLLNNTQATVFSIDCWVDGTENIETEATLNETIERLYPHGRRSIIIKGFSEDVQDFFREDCLGLIYIDALHEYNAIRNDIRSWWPKLKRGGCMSGHDYSQHHWPGVYRAVNEFVNENKLQLFVTSLGDDYGEGDQGQCSFYYFKP